MANISTFLERIRNAIYGEEVRSSIHDAISAMNEESSEAINVARDAQDSAANSASKASENAQIAISATNNAKYWAEQAKSSAGGGVTSFNSRTGSVAPQTGDYDASMISFGNSNVGEVITEIQNGIGVSENIITSIINGTYGES